MEGLDGDGEPLIPLTQSKPYGDNALKNVGTFTYNTLASFTNVPYQIINQVAAESQYIYNNGVGAYFGDVGNTWSNAWNANANYMANTPASQQVADMFNGFDDPHTWDQALGTSAWMFVGGASATSKAANIGKGVSTAGKGANVLKTADPVLSASDALRIENAATRIGKPINVVGSRASGKAGAFSDWDYIIKGINSKEWSKIKNSLPGSKSVMDNTPKNIDLIKTPLDKTKPYITIQPRTK